MSAQKRTVTKTEQTGTAPSPPVSSIAHNVVMGTRAVTRDLKILFKQKKFEIELPNEDNIFVVDFIIKCLGNWEGIVHRFRATIPSNYPFTFPSINCLESEKSFHPNIQPSDGSVCLGILTSEEWKAMYSLSDVCTALSDMFLCPNWEHSLNQEVFQLFHDDKKGFHDRIRSLGGFIATSEILSTPSNSEKAEDLVQEDMKSSECSDSVQCTAVGRDEDNKCESKVTAHSSDEREESEGKEGNGGIEGNGGRGGREESSSDSASSTVCVRAMTDISINEGAELVKSDHSATQSTHSDNEVSSYNAEEIVVEESIEKVEDSSELVQDKKLSSSVSPAPAFSSLTSALNDMSDLSAITETIAMVRSKSSCAIVVLLLLCV
jgi:ubiquitin-protein ligase